jgi:hypothetical protein
MSSSGGARDDQPAPAPAVSSYAALKRPRALLVPAVAMTVVWAGVLSLVLFGPYQGPGPTPVDMLLLFAATACFLGLVWHTMLHRAYRLELASDTLRWRFAWGGGEAPISDLRRIRCARSNPKLGIIEFAGRRPVRVIAVPGLQQFAAEVQKVVPQLETSFAAGGGYRRYR